MHLSMFSLGGVAGIPWGLDQQKIILPRNLTEHFNTGMGPLIHILGSDNEFAWSLKKPSRARWRSLSPEGQSPRRRSLYTNLQSGEEWAPPD